MLRIKQLCIFLYSVCKYRVSIVHHGWIYGKPHTYCDVQFMNFDFVLLLQIWESWWSMQLEILNENLLACFRKPKKKGPQWVFDRIITQKLWPTQKKQIVCQPEQLKKICLYSFLVVSWSEKSIRTLENWDSQFSVSVLQLWNTKWEN